jgi:hypothetical protein
MSQESKIHSLHRYFLWANRMKGHCEEALREQGTRPDGGMELREWLSAPFAYSCYWFATLYVVVEGMRDLRLTSPALDSLLHDQEKVERLRRFRNGVFHYQGDYFDRRFKDFMAEPYFNWARRLHDEISKYFRGWYESQGVIAVVAECNDKSIRIAFASPNSDDVEVILDAVAPASTNVGEPSD